MPTVLVTDARRGSAITIIRSLSKKGWTVVAADSTSHSLGFRSRHARHRFVYPSPTTEPEAYVTAMCEAVSRYSVDLLIPITDATILPLARARIRFAGRCQLAIAGDKALQAVTDKQATLDLCEELGIPVPRTYVAYSVEEVQEAAHLLPWPIVLKAQRSRRMVQGVGVQSTGPVGYANSVKELRDQASRLIEHGPILLQGYQPGSGQGVEMLAYEGRPLAVFQHRRLAEVPITGGASAWRESVPLDPALVDYSRRLVEALHWTGLIMVEFKVGETDAVLMEVNGRVWGSLPLAVHSGMDFPARLAELYLNGSPPPEAPATDYQIGVRASNLELMAVWFAQVARKRRRYPFLPQPGRRDALRALLGMFSRRQKFDVQSWSDPLPGLLQIGQTLAHLRRKARAAS